MVQEVSQCERQRPSPQQWRDVRAAQSSQVQPNRPFRCHFFLIISAARNPAADMLTCSVRPLPKESTGKPAGASWSRETGPPPPARRAEWNPMPSPTPSLMKMSYHQQFIFFQLTEHLFLVISMNKIFSVNFSNFTGVYETVD